MEVNPLNFDNSKSKKAWGSNWSKLDDNFNLSSITCYAETTNSGRSTCRVMAAIKSYDSTDWPTAVAVDLINHRSSTESTPWSLRSLWRNWRVSIDRFEVCTNKYDSRWKNRSVVFKFDRVARCHISLKRVHDR